MPLLKVDSPNKYVIGMEKLMFLFTFTLMFKCFVIINRLTHVLNEGTLICC